MLNDSLMDDCLLGWVFLRLEDSELVHGVGELLPKGLALVFLGLIFGIEFLVVPQKNLLALIIIIIVALLATLCINRTTIIKHWYLINYVMRHVRLLDALEVTYRDRWRWWGYCNDCLA